MARRGVLSPKPLRKVPKPPQSPGEKRVNAYMRQINVQGRRKVGKKR